MESIVLLIDLRILWFIDLKQLDNVPCLKNIRFVFWNLIICFGMGCGIPSAVKNDDISYHSIIVYKFFGKTSTYRDQWKYTNNLAGNKIQFNKKQFQDIDSIIFKASLRAENYASRAIAELYNLTDNSPTINSTLTSKTRNWLHSVNSGDLKYNMPDYPIELTIRLRSEIDGNYSEINGKQVLMVYYK